MKHAFLALLASSAISLAACSGGGTVSSLEENPLYRSYLATSRIDYVTSLRIRARERGEAVGSAKTLRVIDDVLASARRDRERAEADMEEGKRGILYPRGNNSAEGEALLLGDSLYFGYTFACSAAPGPRVLLSAHVAPSTVQDVASEASIDLGPLNVPIGPQAWKLPRALTDSEWNSYRTVVIVSEPLEEIIGIAQIRGTVR